MKLWHESLKTKIRVMKLWHESFKNKIRVNKLRHESLKKIVSSSYDTNPKKNRLPWRSSDSNVHIIEREYTWITVRRI